MDMILCDNQIIIFSFFCCIIRTMTLTSSKRIKNETMLILYLRLTLRTMSEPVASLEDIRKVVSTKNLVDIAEYMGSHYTDHISPHDIGYIFVEAFGTDGMVAIAKVITEYFIHKKTYQYTKKNRVLQRQSEIDDIEKMIKEKNYVYFLRLHKHPLDTSVEECERLMTIRVRKLTRKLDRFKKNHDIQ